MTLTWRSLTRFILALAVSSLASGLRPLPPAQAANGVVTAPCTEAAFDLTLNQVQASGGGTLSFNCGATTAILFSSSKSIYSLVTINGGGVMTLSGGNATRLFEMVQGSALTLTRVTITNGYANGDGGAIYNYLGRLVVDQSTFRDNQTTLAGSGGAILSYGPLTITASLFEDNEGANAGAVYPRHGEAVTYIANSTFRRNHTTSPTDGWGGALLNWDGAPVTIVDSQFISNTARKGGALFVFGPTLIRNSLVLSNTATTSFGSGGGIHNINVLHLDGVTVQGNLAGYSGSPLGSSPQGSSAIGGGLSNIAGTVVITGSTFSRNQAAYFHGIYQAGTLTMTNSTLYSHLSSEAFGTTANTATYLRFVTLAGSGGAALVYNHQNNVFTMRNVLISNPSGVGCAHNLSGPFMTSLGNNLASDGSCYLTQPNDLPSTPALLGPLANNGGPTQTMVPQAGSEAIDGGACQAYAPSDQRGVARAGPGVRHRRGGSANAVAVVHAAAAPLAGGRRRVGALVGLNPPYQPGMRPFAALSRGRGDCGTIR